MKIEKLIKKYFTKQEQRDFKIEARGYKQGFRDAMRGWSKEVKIDTINRGSTTQFHQTK